MKNRLTLLFCFFFLGVNYSSMGQGSSCPSNIDFELGNTSVWNYYIGSNSASTSSTYPAPLCCFTSTAPIANRHHLTSGTGTDPYGGFPVVAPGGGSYSLRLGNSNTGGQAERARYYVHVPAGVANYALIYRFAIVLQDPVSGHSIYERPRFDISARDSVTGAPVNCASYSYYPGGAVPGFYTSSAAGASDVLCLNWTTASINLSGTGGQTIIIDFMSGDCALGGHFGYGYLDMNCSLFQLYTLACDSSRNTISAPFGYSGYTWYDSSTFSTVLATTQTVTFTTTTPTTYAVVLTPYSGYGCPDTLYSRIVPSNLQVRGMHDTTVCFNAHVLMDIGATDIIGPLTYAWSPSAGLSCTTCANPIASPSGGGATTYYVSVTNPAGCMKFDTITVAGDTTSVAVTNTPASCFGTNDGSGTVISSVPLSYSWSCTPPQYTATATGLSEGIYSVTVTDSVGCIAVFLDTITGPPAKILSFSDSTDPTTCGGSDGTIQISGFVPGSIDTISYDFNGTHMQIVVTASGTGTYTMTGLSQGVYSNFLIITTLCPYTRPGTVTLNDPLPPAMPFAGNNGPVCIGDTLKVTVIETTAGCAYSWTGPGGFTAATQNQTILPAAFTDAGTYKVVISKANCFVSDSTVVVVKPAPQPFANNNSPFCEIDTLNLTSYSTNGSNAYSWAGPGFFSSTAQNPVINRATASASGIYTVTMTLGGCIKTATTTVTVNPIPPAPGVVDTEYCQHDAPVQLSATGTNLLWYTDLQGSAGFTLAPTPSTASPGTYSWYVTQTTAAGCVSPASIINVKVDQAPVMSVSISDSVLCVGNYVTFLTSNTGQDYNRITWHFGLDSVVGGNPVVYSFDATGSYTITAQTYYKNCPSQIFTKNVNVFATPRINLGNDTVLCGGSGVIFLADFINGSNSSAHWSWNTGETKSNITVTQPGLYYAHVMINGCEATDSILITKDCYINLPNVFSPNGDGINDYFFPRELLTKGLTVFTMNIYNRWGQLVFTTDKTEGKGWDGMMNGIPQPEGVFIYVIDATFHDGSREHHQGNVTLLR